MDRPVILTSCQAPIADPGCSALARHLGERLGQPVDFLKDLPWQERLRRFDEGAVDVAWICGAPYVQKADRGESLTLLAAPVMAASRYDQSPVYFSDVVVRAGSRYASFACLRGAVFAYNEPGSHSGFHLVRYHLSRLGEDASYFGGVIASGAHQQSLHLIRAGAVDAAAIDSTVLEAVLAEQPELASELKVVATLGPSPMPPWVAGPRLPADQRERLREELLGLHLTSAGADLLAACGMSRFAPITDGDYDPIRRMLRLAGDVELAAAA